MWHKFIKLIITPNIFLSQLLGIPLNEKLTFYYGFRNTCSNICWHLEDQAFVKTVFSDSKTIVEFFLNLSNAFPFTYNVLSPAQLLKTFLWFLRNVKKY